MIMDKTKMSYDPPYLDEEERDMMESFHAALDAGEISAPTDAERAKLNEHWQAVLKTSQERKAITLRLQNRDITRLKSMARRKGIPYQTLISSILHQYANGDMIERSWEALPIESE